MSPQVIHRYTFSMDEAIRALLADACGDCMGWSLRIDAGRVVVDVVEPGAAAPEAPPSEPAPPAAPEETASQPVEDAPPAEPELKGGPLAKRAAILCGERGFMTFLGVSTKEAAAEELRGRCGVTGRAHLDHNEAAGKIWQHIEGQYRLWLAGHDVEI